MSKCVKRSNRLALLGFIHFFSIVTIIMSWSVQSSDIVSVGSNGPKAESDRSSWYYNFEEAISPNLTKPTYQLNTERSKKLAAPLSMSAVKDTKKNKFSKLDSSFNVVSETQSCPIADSLGSGTPEFLRKFVKYACELSNIPQQSSNDPNKKNDAASTCEMIVKAKKDNSCDFGNGLSHAETREVIENMKKGINEADEVEKKVEEIAKDMKEMRNVSLLQTNFASNPVILYLMKERLQSAADAAAKAKADNNDEGEQEHFDALLDKYGMREAFEKGKKFEKDKIFEITTLSKNAFSCTPDKLKADKSRSKLDETLRCEVKRNKEGRDIENDLLSRAKKKFVEDCRKGLRSCPTQLKDHPSIGTMDTESLYDFYVKNIINSNLNGEAAIGSTSIASLTDFGTHTSEEKRELSLRALQIFTSRGKFKKVMKDFKSLKSDLDSRNLMRGEKRREMRKRGVDLMTKDYINTFIGKEDPHFEAKSKIIKNMARAFKDQEDNGRRYNQALNGIFDVEGLGKEVANFTEEEKTTLSKSFYTSLGVAANYAEDTYNRLETADKLTTRFGLTTVTDSGEEEVNNPLNRMLKKMEGINESGQEDSNLSNDLREMLADSPFLRSMVELNANEDDDLGTKIQKVIEKLIEGANNVDTGASSKNFENQLRLAELSQVDESIERCRKRVKKKDRDGHEGQGEESSWRSHRVRRHLCSSGDMAVLGASGLNQLFQNLHSDDSDNAKNLSKALLYCGPVVQQSRRKAEKDERKGRAKGKKKGSRNKAQRKQRKQRMCFDLSTTIYGAELTVKDRNEFDNQLFGVTCKSSEVLKEEEKKEIQQKGWNNIKNTSGSIDSRIMNSDSNKLSMDDLVSNFKEASKTLVSVLGSNKKGHSSTVSDSFIQSLPIPDRIAESGLVRDYVPESFKNSFNARAWNEGLPQSPSAPQVLGPVTEVADHKDQLSSELEGYESKLSPESNELLNKLRDTEQKLARQKKLYDDLSNKKEGEKLKRAEEKELSDLEAQKKKLLAESRDLESQLSNQSDVAQVLSSNDANTYSRSASRRRGPYAAASSPVAQATVAAPVATSAGTASRGSIGSSSGGGSRSPSSYTAGSSQTNTASGSSGKTSAGLKLTEEGAVNSGHKYTSKKIKEISLKKEVVGQILDNPAQDPNTAVMIAKKPILIPTETKGLFAMYIPLRDDNKRIVTRDGRVEFKAIVRVWINEIGGDASKVIRLHRLDNLLDGASKAEYEAEYDGPLMKKDPL